MFSLLIKMFGSEHDILTATGQIALKFGMNIHTTQRIIDDDFSALTFAKNLIIDKINSSQRTYQTCLKY